MRRRRRWRVDFQRTARGKLEAIQLHQMAEKYGKRPSDLLRGPLGDLALDATVFGVACDYEKRLGKASESDPKNGAKLVAMQMEREALAERRYQERTKGASREGLAPDLFDKIFGPMGLDIGAITPEEIAVSVVAEMIAMRRQPEANWRTLSKSIFAHEKIRVLATR